MLRAAVVLILFSVPAAAEDKYKAEDLVGSWKRVKSTKDDGLDSVTITFSKDGVYTARRSDDTTEPPKGKWKLVGDKLEITILNIAVCETTIEKLTADTLVLKDLIGKDECQRVKEEKK